MAGKAMSIQEEMELLGVVHTDDGKCLVCDED
jgi:hypothetical protein